MDPCLLWGLRRPRVGGQLSTWSFFRALSWNQAVVHVRPDFGSDAAPRWSSLSPPTKTKLRPRKKTRINQTVVHGTRGASCKTRRRTTRMAVWTMTDCSRSAAKDPAPKPRIQTYTKAEARVGKRRLLKAIAISLYLASTCIGWLGMCCETLGARTSWQESRLDTAIEAYPCVPRVCTY